MKQIEYFGEGTIENINEIIRNQNIERVLLVTGKGSYESSGAKMQLNPITEMCKTKRFFDFSPNPELEDVLNGIQVCRDFDPQMIIAVGGGSTIDMGKLIRIFTPQEASPIDLVTKQKPIEAEDISNIPLVAIPTTAGSGSEATHFAVVYVSDDKYSVAHENILADYSIIDPNLSSSMSPELTAVTGMDAFCHAVESYWAVGSNPESREYAKEALEIILMSLEKSVNSPSTQSRTDMAYAANLSGKAINISKTTAAHALSYAITKQYGVPHGHATALTIGMFFLINSQSDKYELLNPETENRMEELCTILNQKDSCECKYFINQLMRNIGLKTNLEEFGINDVNQLRDIVNSVNIERLNNHPMKLSKADLVDGLILIS